MATLRIDGQIAERINDDFLSGTENEGRIIVWADDRPQG